MLRLENVCKTYPTSEVETLALNSIPMEIGPGGFVAIMGPSGCGAERTIKLLDGRVVSEALLAA